MDDVVNNRNTSHRSNNNEPCGRAELTKIHTKHADCFSAILYCQRIGAENIFDELRCLSILIVDVKRSFLSKGKQKMRYVRTELLKLHPSAMEAMFMQKILKHEDYLYCLVLQQRSKSLKRNRNNPELRKKIV